MCKMVFPLDLYVADSRDFPGLFVDIKVDFLSAEKKRRT